ncbi:DUF4333 domain-containing protein [Candidatus Solirubrobacter pratensis]|uniref:DUF4333 domain-containing protein n=1 Tax=Candidatus Solirubrobacter pratensis TaxID=1298857 RepID=UPI0003F5ECDC|nr:DUF4333 domain-containing protein [Candidatus Solirubrobacter pratensis]
MNLLRSTGVEDGDIVDGLCQVDSSSSLNEVIDAVCAKRYCGEDADPRLPGVLTADALEQEVADYVHERGGEFESLECPKDAAVGPGDSTRCHLVGSSGDEADIVLTVTGDTENLHVEVDAG